MEVVGVNFQTIFFSVKMRLFHAILTRRNFFGISPQALHANPIGLSLRFDASIQGLHEASSGFVYTDMHTFSLFSAGT